MDTKLFCSGEYVLKKCVYYAFAAQVYSELEAKGVIERIGKLVKNIDVCPFSVRLLITTTLEEQEELERGAKEGGIDVDKSEEEKIEIDEDTQRQKKLLFQKEQVFSEDNGDLGVGGLLSELLLNEGTENMMLLVTRVVKGTFPPEMVNQTKLTDIQSSAKFRA